MYSSAASRPSQHFSTVTVGPSVPDAPIRSTRSQWMPSSAALTVTVPPVISRSCSALMPSLTPASISSVTPLTFSHASPSVSVVAPDLMPFFPLALSFSVPVPQMVTCEPSLHLMTAFSAFSLSGYVSSLFFAESVRVFTVPAAAAMVTPVDFAQVMGAVSALVSVSPLRISVTPVTPFFTFMEPSAQLPDTEYTPAS